MKDGIFDDNDLIQQLDKVIRKGRTVRNRLKKTFNVTDETKVQLSQLITSLGYELIFPKGTSFYWEVIINSNFKLKGYINLSVVGIDAQYNFGDTVWSNGKAGISSVELEKEYIAKYKPVFEAMIENGLTLCKIFDKFKERQAKADSLNEVVIPLMKSLGVDDTRVVADISDESNLFLRKKCNGIMVNSAINIENYKEICAQFASTFSRFPSLYNHLNVSFIKCSPIELEQNYVYINPKNYTFEDVRMMYADAIEPIKNKDIDMNNKIVEALEHMGFIYSYNQLDESFEIKLTSFQSLFLNNGSIFIKTITESGECTTCTDNVDELHFIRMLYLIALSSQNGGLSASLDKVDDNEIFLRILISFLYVLVPHNVIVSPSLAYFNTFSIILDKLFEINYGINIAKEGFNQVIDYLDTVVHDIEDFISIPNFWEQEDKQSPIDILMLDEQNKLKWTSLKS